MERRWASGVLATLPLGDRNHLLAKPNALVDRKFANRAKDHVGMELPVRLPDVQEAAPGVEKYLRHFGAVVAAPAPCLSHEQRRPCPSVVEADAITDPKTLGQRGDRRLTGSTDECPMSTAGESVSQPQVVACFPEGLDGLGGESAPRSTE